MTHVWHKREKLYYSECTMTIIIKEIQNLVFSQIRATALILLNYISGPTGHLGVNADIIDIIQPSHVMGVLTKQKKSTSVQGL